MLWILPFNFLFFVGLVSCNQGRINYLFEYVCVFFFIYIRDWLIDVEAPQKNKVIWVYKLIEQNNHANLLASTSTSHKCVSSLTFVHTSSVAESLPLRRRWVCHFHLRMAPFKLFRVRHKAHWLNLNDCRHTEPTIWWAGKSHLVQWQ